jgi:hypothetical protein
MTKSFAIALLSALLGIAVPVSAQTETSKLEAYGGFYYSHFNINANVSGFPPASTYNGYGGGGQLEYNATNLLGIAGDLAGYYFPTQGYPGGAFSYLFGPRLNFRRGKLTPFAQVLPGGILTSSGIGQPGPQNHFAMAAGGGIDFTVSQRIALRPAQAEYFMTKIPDGFNNRQNNFRFSTGIAVRLTKSVQ